MFISKPGVRAISFGEMLTSRNLYIVLAIFAMGALAAFVYTGQSTNSVATINTTLSEPEAVKIKLNGVNIIAMANLPGNTTLSLAGITSALPVNATGTYDLSGTDKKIVVGVLGSNQTTAFAGAPYVNNSSVYSTADRATASRILISNTNLGQDLLGYDYAGTGAVLGTASAYIYVSNANGA